MVDHNPTEASPPGEGGGGSADIVLSGKFRSDMRLLTKALRDGWEVPGEVRRAAIMRMAKVLANGNGRPRDWARAAQTLLAMDKLALDAIAEADRMNRLDKGLPTTITEIVTPEQLVAVAQTYWRTEGQALPPPTA